MTNDFMKYKCPKIKYFNQTSDSIITVRIEELHNKTWIESPHKLTIFIDTLTISYKDTTHKFGSMAQLMQFAYNI